MKKNTLYICVFMYFLIYIFVYLAAPKTRLTVIHQPSFAPLPDFLGVNTPTSHLSSTTLNWFKLNSLKFALTQWWTFRVLIFQPISFPSLPDNNKQTSIVLHSIVTQGSSPHIGRATHFVVSGSLWLTLAQSGSLWLAARLSLAPSGSLRLSLALYCSLLLSKFAYQALARLTRPLLSSERRS